jgi:hypothetical protein
VRWFGAEAQGWVENDGLPDLFAGRAQLPQHGVAERLGAGQVGVHHEQRATVVRPRYVRHRAVNELEELGAVASLGVEEGDPCAPKAEILGEGQRAAIG